MARWVNIKHPFDRRISSTQIEHHKLVGDQYLVDDLADFVVGKGYATEGKEIDSAATADLGRHDSVDRSVVAEDDRPIAGDDVPGTDAG